MAGIPRQQSASVGGVRRVYYDSEFLVSDFTPAGLISVGIVDDAGRELYAVNADMDEAAVRAHPWLAEHVWPHLPHTPAGDLDRTHPSVMPASRLREELDGYFTPQHEGEQVVLYAYFGAQDLVHLQGLWDHDWTRMPHHIPRWAEDLKALAVRAGDPAPAEYDNTDHHALDDAHANQQAHRRLHGRTTSAMSRGYTMRELEEAGRRLADARTALAECLRDDAPDYAIDVYTGDLFDAVRAWQEPMWGPDYIDPVDGPDLDRMRRQTQLDGEETQEQDASEGDSA